MRLGCGGFSTDPAALRVRALQTILSVNQRPVMHQLTKPDHSSGADQRDRHLFGMGLGSVLNSALGNEGQSGHELSQSKRRARKDRGECHGRAVCQK